MLRPENFFKTVIAKVIGQLRLYLNLINVASRKNFYHFLPQAVGNFQPGFGWQFINVGVKKIILQVNILNQHFGMEDIGLINIDIHSVIAAQGLLMDII